MTTANGQTLVAIQSVTFVYGDGTEALKEVSLEIPCNEVFVLFGPARSGKTTLLRMLNRLSDLSEQARHRGTILFNGKDIFDRDVDVAGLRRRVSMVFALPSPLPGSIRDNLTYGLKVAGIRSESVHDERIERALQQAALWDEVKDRLNSSAFALSGGQQQRLCLARSLALEPELILLDNPTSGLDPISTGIVEESLQELKKQYTIIMVPHSVQQGARVADRAGFLLDGELVEVGTAEGIFVNPRDQRTSDYVMGRFG